MHTLPEASGGSYRRNGHASSSDPSYSSSVRSNTEYDESETSDDQKSATKSEVKFDVKEAWGQRRAKRLSRVINPRNTGLFSVDNHEVGDEPGIDVDTVDVEMPDSLGSHIVICDYSPDKFQKTHLDVQKDYNSYVTGSTEKKFLNRPLATVLQMRPKWSKVRWVVVNGMSWEALQPIAKVYQLHPLAIEDMLDIPQRTKSDMYTNQAFCCFPLHIMAQSKTPFGFRNRIARSFIVFLHAVYVFLKGLPTYRQGRQRPSDCESQTEKVEEGEEPLDTGTCDLFYTSTNGVTCMQKSLIIDALERLPSRSMYDWYFGNSFLREASLQNMQISGTEYSQEINVEQVSLFIEGSTVITFFEKSLDSLYAPIEKRLRSRNTMLRITSDPHILVQAILDANVDLFRPIVRDYKTRLSKLELKGLKHPNKQLISSLHSFRTDLTILRTPLESISTFADSFGSKIATHFTRDKTDTNVVERRRTVSEIASLYFKDVAGHTTGFLQDVENMMRHAEMLSNFICNTITMKGNDYVKMLSLVSIVFLPLTFLTGYFGMNFKSFDQLSNDVSYYWLIATPATAALLVTLMYPSIATYLIEFYTWAHDQVVPDT